MLIVCPACASAYRIDAGKVGMEGRSVRCAACRETWFLTPAEVLAAREAELAEAAGAEPDPVSDAAWHEAADAVRTAAEEATAAEPPARRRGAAKPPRAGSGRLGKRRARLGLSPALALGLAVLAALPIACLARGAVVRAAPQTASLYARIGLPVNLRGIEIRDVAAFSTPGEDGRPAELVIEGELFGVGPAHVPVAALEAEIRDAGGRVVRTFPVPAPRAVLGAGETARFRASLPAPPASGREVEMRFSGAGPSRAAIRMAAQAR